jgi:hypothetical protein
MGFCTTRWVQALTPGRAELRAVEMIRRDPSFALPKGVSPPADARVYLEKIDRIDKLPRFRGGGATWFREEPESVEPRRNVARFRKRRRLS